jgi:SIR2-like domain
MRKAFMRGHPDFREDLATSQLSSESYPDFFELCKTKDKALYNRTLVELLGSPSPGPVYKQLIESIRLVRPLQIVTTNVDLCLEQSSGMIDLIEHTDLERCSNSILNRTPFIAKLHGSVSSVESVVFATSDYERILESASFMAAMRSIFTMASVIFFGYGLRDRYVLDAINKNYGEHILFGNGPHFLITEMAGPPQDGVHRIAYKSAHYQDHRAALTVLNVIQQEQSTPVMEFIPRSRTRSPAKKESGFYISSFTPSGTHITGQAFEFGRQDLKGNAIVGLGFVKGELPSAETVAFHDLAVGLICFDHVFLPLRSLPLLHQRGTDAVFWALTDCGAIKFVDIVDEPVYVATPESSTGDIAVLRVQDPEDDGTRTPMSVVRKMIKPVPGMEEEAEKRTESLKPWLVQFSNSERRGLPAMVRSALLMPLVSRLLGYSEFVVPNRIPRWLAHPTLRLAHLVQTGLICNELGIRASRVPFGGESLLSAAFSVKPPEETVFDYASFALSGAYGSNLSSFIEAQPKSLLEVLKFRESPEGAVLRREISDRLDTNDGTEFSVAIQGALKRSVPTAVLQSARNRFSSLLKAQSPHASAGAVWADVHTGDSSLRLWRERSRELLLAEAKRRGLRSDSSCLCGSGDPLRDCCMKSLR